MLSAGSGDSVYDERLDGMEFTMFEFAQRFYRRPKNGKEINQDNE